MNAKTRCQVSIPAFFAHFADMMLRVQLDAKFGDDSAAGRAG